MQFLEELKKSAKIEGTKNVSVVQIKTSFTKQDPASEKKQITEQYSLQYQVQIPKIHKQKLPKGSGIGASGEVLEYLQSR